LHVILNAIYVATKLKRTEFFTNLNSLIAVFYVFTIIIAEIVD